MNNFNKLNVFIMHLGYIILFGFVSKNYWVLKLYSGMAF